MSDTIAAYESKLRRPMHVGCRLSDKEYALVSAAATGANLPLADWFRRTILDSLTPNGEPTPTILLEEIQAIKLIFASTVPPILADKRMTEEQSVALMRNCESAKTDAAKKVLKTFQDRKDRP
jgi:hypothetical protein